MSEVEDIVSVVVAQHDSVDEAELLLLKEPNNFEHLTLNVVDNKFVKYLKEKFYDSIMFEPEVEDAFNYMVGEPVFDTFVSNEDDIILTIRLIIDMRASDATYWKLKHM